MTDQEVQEAAIAEAQTVLDEAIQTHAKALEAKLRCEELLKKYTREYHDAVTALDNARTALRFARRRPR